MMFVVELNEPPSGVDDRVNVVSKLVEVRRYATRLGLADEHHQSGRCTPTVRQRDRFQGPLVVIGTNACYVYWFVLCFPWATYCIRK